jgi:hypothetical protein
MTDTAPDPNPLEQPPVNGQEILRAIEQPPVNVQDVLRAIIAAGNVAHMAEDKEVRAGPRGGRGAPLPLGMAGVLAYVTSGLLAGERFRLLTIRLGRHVARTGGEAGFDDSVTDIDLAAWGRGEVDYLTTELVEVIELHHHRTALTRRDALFVLLIEGVVAPADARRDVY